VTQHPACAQLAILSNMASNRVTVVMRACCVRCSCAQAALVLQWQALSSQQQYRSGGPCC
jgi:hypothetical protein